MARIARILKLIKAAEGLRILVETTFKSLGQVGNVGILLFLFFFIYAAAGVEMFGKLACKKDVNECNGLSEHANFENFFIAMLTLFRIWTGDNGNGILKDALREEPECSAHKSCKENCCVTNPVLAVVYFLSFTVIAQFILLNVVIAVLMAQLEESTADEERRSDEEGAKQAGEVVAVAEEADTDRPSSMGSWTFTDDGNGDDWTGWEKPTAPPMSRMPVITEEKSPERSDGADWGGLGGAVPVGSNVLKVYPS